MKAYKLTDKYGRTQGGTQWGPNVTHEAIGVHKELCSNGWIHFYRNPLIAVLMNPAHADFYPARLWECKTSGKHKHEALKSGCKRLTTIKEIPLPKITTKQRVAFAILCTKQVCKSYSWGIWVDKWLEGSSNRSRKAANVAILYAVIDTANAVLAVNASNAAYEAANAAANAATSAGNTVVNFNRLAQKALAYEASS